MKTNRLAQEKSPYLLQHQHNPVDWHPWGEEAFEKARLEERPIFLSIGYSTCHWCHVMERESFENEAVAHLLNRHFVPIKVDREERPDVDRLYMTFVQASTGSGGWPLSAFLTPDLKPFFGGTYFPPEDRYNRPGFVTLLQRIAQAWEHDRERLVQHGDSVVSTLQEAHETPRQQAEGGAADLATLERAAARIMSHFDPEEGGFSGAPKFPRPVTFHFLFRYAALTRDRNGAAKAREAALFTLRKMALGGMHDHLGGGFHRYSVDRYWHVPHFEKMLYDQALLAVAYLEAFQIAGRPEDAAVAADILDYVQANLLGPEGGFYCAEDADSPHPDDPSQSGEGAFYVWTRDEIADALAPEAAAIFNRAYGVEKGGNAPQESDPHGELTGKNTLIRRVSDEELAAQFKSDPETIARSLAESRRTLLTLRNQRPRPHLDDKILTAWNGMMISAFARAAHLLPQENRDDLGVARRAAAFLRQHLQRDGRLLRSWREGPGETPAFAEDYAFTIAGLLDLYEAGAGIEWLRWAVELQEIFDHLFFDERHGGYFSTAGTDPALFLRMKDDYDGAEPSSNSIAVANALRLADLLDDAALRERADRTLESFADQLRRTPEAVPLLLGSLAFSLSEPEAFIVAGTPVEPWLHELGTRFLPFRTIRFADGGEGQAWLARRLGFLRELAPPEGVPSALYLCRAHACLPPITEFSATGDELERFGVG
ncbi:MAG TPA: thioredoxin domain-containing protein [Chthoniobacteraceae bacterium]|nr:thioredoxin domain-containing protein [Chthoniobacteraceae bacterium]